MSELLSQLQQLGDGEIDDLSIAHDASEEIVALRLRVAELALRLRVAELAEALEEALEEIAQSCDSGRHDGLPEDGPALDDVEAWLVANDALAAYRKQGGEA